MNDISPDERSVLHSIDAIVRSKQVQAQIQAVVSRARAELARKTEAVMTWEPIPLEVFRGPASLPPEIKSSWVFVLRAGVNTGAERHPNSHQRMMSWEGSGDMRTVEGSSQEDAREGSEWRSNVLISDPAAPLKKRWISIPPNVWHQPVVGLEADWVVVSFHTVPAEELIEERPDGSRQGDGKTKQMRYLG